MFLSHHTSKGEYNLLFKHIFSRVEKQMWAQHLPISIGICKADPVELALHMPILMESSGTVQPRLSQPGLW